MTLLHTHTTWGKEEEEENLPLPRHDSDLIWRTAGTITLGIKRLPLSLDQFMRLFLLIQSNHRSPLVRRSNTFRRQSIASQREKAELDEKARNRRIKCEAL